MTIVAFLCFIALVAAWFVAPKEMEMPEVVSHTGSEMTAPAAS